MKKILYAVLTAAILTMHVQAQKKPPPYTNTDNFVQKLGALNSFNVATIADTITRNFSDKEQKARAIFYWIANNITLDPKAVKQQSQKNTLPEEVVQIRKTTPLGFSLLMQEMCSLANIRCLSVDGYIKNSAEEINEKADEKNHSWNVVQLGQSPEEWFYIDASRGCGFLDKRLTAFTKYFTSEYFFADRILFNLDHYPDNNAWQLGAGPKTVKEFYALPVFENAAFEYGLGKPKPLTGFIKTSNNATVAFSFPHNEKPVTSVELVLGDIKKSPKPEPMNFTDDAGIISFTYQFKKAETYPVTILVNSKPVLDYNLEVTEKN